MKVMRFGKAQCGYCRTDLSGLTGTVVEEFGQEIPACWDCRPEEACRDYEAQAEARAERFEPRGDVW